MIYGTEKLILVNKYSKKNKNIIGDRTNSEARPYITKKVLYINLFDTSLINLSDSFYSVHIGIERNNFINNTITLNKVNDFLYFI